MTYQATVIYWGTNGRLPGLSETNELMRERTLCEVCLEYVKGLPQVKQVSHVKQTGAGCECRLHHKLNGIKTVSA